MAKRQVPAQFIFTCDGCGKDIGGPNDRRPQHWAEVIIKRDAYDFQGAGVADASTSFLFCGTCADKASKLVHAIGAEP